MNYKDIQANIKRKEIKWLACLTVILLCGIISEVLTRIGRTMIFIDDFPALALAVISIQATVATLVITVQSLMTGKMDEAFQGVSINDFLMNIKPWLFKQKRIIIVEFIGVGVNIFLQMFALYNMIIAIFCATMVLVLISILQVYEAFLGTERLNEEIVAYITDDLVECNKSDENGHQRILHKFEGFCRQWRDETTVQSKATYDEYLGTFKIFFEYLYSDDKDRIKLLSECEKLSRLQLTSANTTITWRGICFVKDCYGQALVCTRDHDYKIKSISEGFNLLSGVFEDLLVAFRDVDIEKLEKDFHCGSFINAVIENSVNMLDRYLKMKKATDLTKDEAEKALKKPPSIKADLRSVKDFASYVGDYIASNSSKINIKTWGQQFDFLNLRSYRNVNSNLDVLRNSATIGCYFNFILSQVKRGYYAVSREYYKWLRKSIHDQDTDEFAYAVLKLHCYIYYLSFYETTECVEQTLIDSAKAFIYEENTRNAFRDYVEGICYTEKNVIDPEYAEVIIRSGENVHDIFNSKLKERLYKDLRNSEFMPGNFVVKYMVMQDVAIDFVTFLTTYIGNSLQNYTVLDHIISEENSSLFYKKYVSNECSKQLRSFFNIMEPSDNNGILRAETLGFAEDDNITLRVSAAYEELALKIKEKYKAYTLHTAHSDLKYTNEDYKKQGEKAAEDLLQFLKKRFRGIISNNLIQEENGNIFKRNGYERACILKIGIMSDTDIGEVIKTFYDRIYKVLILGIISKLHNAGFIKETNKSEKSDDEWLDFLKSHENVIALGAQGAFYSKNKIGIGEVLEWLREIEHYTYPGYGTAALIKEGCLKLDFRNIEFRVRPESFSEAIGNKTQPDPETGMYQYEPSVGMPVQFTKEELKDYLEDKRRVVEVFLDIGVNVAKDEMIGEEYKTEYTVFKDAKQV